MSLRYLNVLTKEKLLFYYVTHRKTIKQIALIFNVGINTVKRYMKKFDIKIRNTTGINNGMFGKKRPDLAERNRKNKKHGKYCKDRKNYCLDCSILISPNAIRCRRCEFKHRKDVGEFSNEKSPNYRHGKYSKNYKKYCMKCGKLLSVFYAKKCLYCYTKSLKSECNPNWKGGLSFEEYGAEFDNSLKEAIRQRDGYKCQLCGCSQLENGRQLSIHHIDYNKKNNKFDNLISLCDKCHGKTNGNRKLWEKILKNKIKGVKYGKNNLVCIHK